MKQKLLFFVLSLVAIAAFLGCHAGGSAPFINTPSDSEIYSKEYDVLENGRFADIYLPSGAVIKCTADHTLKPGTKVTVTEQKLPNETPAYLYNITGKLYTGDALNSTVPVNSIEKPISVTIPNNSESGFCYIGSRASENEPWRYTLAGDGGLGNLRYSRLSVSSPKVCYFDIYRLNIQFRLFVFDNEGTDKAEVDFVDFSTGSKDKKISIENDKYAEDLEIKITLYGEKLDSINADNLTAKIIYRSKDLNPVQLKANGSIVKQNDSDDKAVSGKYEHSFEINNVNIDSSMSGESVLSFVLNLKDISLKDFPTDFLVELYSDTKGEKVLPFIYTKAYSFETKEKQDTTTDTGSDTDTDTGSSTDTDTDTGSSTDTDTDTGSSTDTDTSIDVYSITYNLDGGQLATTNPTEYTVETADFTLTNPTKTGYTFKGWSGTDLDGDSNETVTIVKGSTGDKTYTANWKLNLTLAIASDTGSVFEPQENNLYKFTPTFTITPTLAEGVIMTSNEKSDILEALKVNDANGVAVNSNLINKSWNNGNIALSFNSELEACVTYTISFGDIDSVNLTCSPLSFTTFYFKGSGSSDDPYQIASATQLNLVRNYLDKDFKQTEDISLESFENWVPIGDNPDSFTGSYDGGNKKITKLTINTKVNYAGLFGYSTSIREIKNILAEDFYISNNIYCGGICGYLQKGSISSCYVASSTICGGDISAAIGGICGFFQNGSMSSCYVASSTIGNSNDMVVGGICGAMGSNSSISSCYVTSSTISGSTFIGGYGGICGINDGGISSCFTDISANPVGTGSSGSTNCVENNITSFEAFSNISWPSDAWNDFNMSETVWPPKLKTEN